MGIFRDTLLSAQQGDEAAMEKLLKQYEPLLMKCSCVQGNYDEDLHQILLLEFVQAISAFNI